MDPVTRAKKVAPELTLQLEAMAIRAMGGYYDDLNGTFFGGALRRPVLGVSETLNRLGQWTVETRSLHISRELLIRGDWGAVVDTFKHEMAHQYVHEVLGILDQSAHGPAFTRTCSERGIDSRATVESRTGSATTPACNSPGDVHPNRAVEKVAKLLALAESANENEARAAMNAAQRLMLRFNIDDIDKPERRQSYRHLGRATGRVSESERVLAQILNEHFFVSTIWVSVWRVLEGKRGSVLEACGTTENLELAEYVHDFLTRTAGRLWTEHKQANGIQRDRDRRAFLAGVMAGFRRTLRSQAKVHSEQGMVWMGDPEVAAFLKRRHPYTRTTRHKSSSRSDAHADGCAAGSKIVLRRGVKGTSSGGVKQLTR